MVSASSSSWLAPSSALERPHGSLLLSSTGWEAGARVDLGVLSCFSMSQLTPPGGTAAAPPPVLVPVPEPVSVPALSMELDMELASAFILRGDAPGDACLDS